MSSESAAVTEPQQPGLRGQQIDALLAAGKADEAEQAARDGIAAYPNSIALLRRLAEILFRTKRQDDALAVSAKSIAIEPNSAALHFQRAIYLIGGQNFAAAEQSLNTAVTLTPDNPRFLARLAEICLRLNKKELARQWIEKALAVAPDDANVHARRAAMQLMESDSEGAEVSLRIAIEKDPAVPGYLLGLSDIYRDRHDFMTALELADRAAAINPNNPHPYAHRAAIYLAAADFDAAEQGFRKALELQPGLAIYEKRLADVAAQREAREAQLAVSLEAARVAEAQAEHRIENEAQPESGRKRRFWKQLFQN